MSEMLRMQLEVTYGIFQINTDEITHEDSLHQPSESGNCMNWIAGHLVATYDSVLPTLGEEPVWDQERKDLYKRGSDPMPATHQAIEFDEIRQAFTAAHQCLMRGLDHLDEARLAEPAPFSPGNNPDETLGTLLHLIAFHQAYHVGQLGLGRRLVGKAGGVK